jgi:hypothetical protein
MDRNKLAEEIRKEPGWVANFHNDGDEILKDRMPSSET